RGPELDAGGPGGVDHRPRVRGRRRERLLAEDVHARLRGQLGVTAVVGVARRDHDRVTRREQSVQRRMPSRRMRAGGPASALLIIVVDPGELDLIKRAERVRETRRVNMRERNEANAKAFTHAGAFQLTTSPVSAERITARPSASERRPSCPSTSGGSPRAMRANRSRSWTR